MTIFFYIIDTHQVWPLTFPVMNNYFKLIASWSPHEEESQWSISRCLHESMQSRWGRECTWHVSLLGGKLIDRSVSCVSFSDGFFLCLLRATMGRHQRESLPQASALPLLSQLCRVQSVFWKLAQSSEVNVRLEFHGHVQLRLYLRVHPEHLYSFVLEAFVLDWHITPLVIHLTLLCYISDPFVLHIIVPL